MRRGWLGVSFVALTMVAGCTFDDGQDDSTTTPAVNEVKEGEVKPVLPSAATVSTIAELHAIDLEFPEGLAVRNGEAFIGLAPQYAVERVDASGKLVPFAKFPDGGFGMSSGLIGIAFDARGRLYGAITSESGK